MSSNIVGIPWEQERQTRKQHHREKQVHPAGLSWCADSQHWNLVLCHCASGKERYGRRMVTWGICQEGMERSSVLWGRALKHCWEAKTHLEREQTPASTLSSERWLKITAQSSPRLALTLLSIWNLNHSGVTLSAFFRCSQWACCWFLSPTSYPWSMACIKVSCI